jgi:2-C-methyl-D-erythritol 4-phosphate cytidylyltransferase
MAAGKALIIPAAGEGKRMQRKQAKPFISLHGQPILGHTIQRFLSVSGLKQILIAATPDYLSTVRQILRQTAGNSILWNVVEGGATRQQSIGNALKRLSKVDLVMVHDAVRPFVTKALIEKCCRKAEKTGAAVPGLPCKNTLKIIDKNHLVRKTPDRDQLWQIQTPQIFNAGLLKKAYSYASRSRYVGTDDASLVERLGEPVKVVQGSADNIKLTYPRDLQLADLIFKNENTAE